MKFIVVTPPGEMEIRDVSGLHGYQEAVGGLIEHVFSPRLPSPYTMYANEEGLLYNMPMNLCGCYFHGTDIHGVPIVGNIIITKEGMTEDGPSLVGMEEEEALRIGNKLQAESDGAFHWRDKPEN